MIVDNLSTVHPVLHHMDGVVMWWVSAEVHCITALCAVPEYRCMAELNCSVHCGRSRGYFCLSLPTYEASLDESLPPLSPQENERKQLQQPPAKRFPDLSQQARLNHFDYLQGSRESSGKELFQYVGSGSWSIIVSRGFSG